MNKDESAFLDGVYSPDEVKKLPVGYAGDLSKREYFAGLAMQGMLSSCDVGEDIVAKGSVRYADALMKELSKESDGE